MGFRVCVDKLSVFIFYIFRVYIYVGCGVQVYINKVCLFIFSYFACLYICRARGFGLMHVGYVFVHFYIFHAYKHVGYGVWGSCI